jgi:hypothetical protein
MKFHLSREDLYTVLEKDENYLEKRPLLVFEKYFIHTWFPFYMRVYGV